MYQNSTFLIHEICHIVLACGLFFHFITLIILYPLAIIARKIKQQHLL